MEILSSGSQLTLRGAAASPREGLVRRQQPWGGVLLPTAHQVLGSAPRMEDGRPELPPRRVDPTNDIRLPIAPADLSFVQHTTA